MPGFIPVIDGVQQFKNPNKSRIHVLREWEHEIAAAPEGSGASDVVAGLGEVERDATGAPVKVGPYPITVGGRLVKPIQIRVFQDWCSTGGTLKKIAERHGIAEITLKSWKYQPWWKEWARIWFEKTSMELQRGVYARDQKLLRAYSEIIDGKRKDDKSVNAQAQLFKTRMEMGADPIINKRPVHTTVNAIQNTNIVVTPESVRQLAKKDPAKIREWMATGVKPVELNSGNEPAPPEE